MEKEITCIICPLGCRITVKYSKGTIHDIGGFQCEKGKDYAIQEIFNPVRMLTTTIMVKNGVLPLVSVKTNKPVPKDKLFEVMDAIAQIELSAPIKMGDILVEDIPGLDVHVVATKHVEAIKNKH